MTATVRRPRFSIPIPATIGWGRFKFKSTPKGQRPTHDDLKNIVLEGSRRYRDAFFQSARPGEVESLVHYVKYLSIRGEVERRLSDEVGRIGRRSAFGG